MSARVLIVDDSSTVRRITSEMLIRRGFQCSEAIDGRAALALLQAAPADVVLVDFVMPGMNGFQFCRELRNHPQLRNTPVILVSAKSHRIRERFIEQTGALDALGKPFDENALVAVVENALRRVRAGLTGEAPLVTEELFVEPNGSVPPGPMEDSTQVHVPAVLVLKLAEKLAGYCGKSQDELLRDFSERLPPEDAHRIVAAAHDTETGTILSGRVPTIPIGAVMNVIHAEHLSGKLRLMRDASTITVTFREGAVALAEARNGGDEFRLGRFLVEEAALTQGQLEAALAEGSQVPLGTRLLRAGTISEDVLRRVLTRQSSELIYDVLRWRKGRFEFVRESSAPLAYETNLKISVANLLIEGYRRVEEWQHLESALGPFDSVFVQVPDAHNQIDFEALAPGERAVLSLIDGTRTVREVMLASSFSSFDTARALVQFSAAKVVVRRGYA